MAQFDPINDRKYEAVTTSDFVAAATEGGFASTVSGTGAANTVTAVDGHPGVLSCSAGTTATGSAFTSTAAAALYSDGGVLRVDALVKFATLSDASQEYSAVAGFGDTATTHDQVDGAYIYYDRANDGTNFFIATAKGSTRTEVDTGLAVVADTWYNLTVVLEGSAAYFYINDVAVGTITTNVPDAVANAFGIVAGILKSVGTTARTLEVDYINAKVTPAINR